MSLPNSLHHFQIKTFTRNAQELSGQATLADFPRVLAEAADDAPPSHAQVPVHWRLLGEQRPDAQGQPQSWLLTQVSTEVYLSCQRCLQPVAVPVQTEQWFRFVDTTQQADEQDAESEEDVLTFDEAQDVHALLEDDLLMALPIVALHEACPVPLAHSGAAPVQQADAVPAKRPNPFAALASLRLPKQDEAAD